jgi:3-hydroxyisobutyrate dehydrogenase-like beta-hydroxyacid dehydrogenase
MILCGKRIYSALSAHHHDDGAALARACDVVMPSLPDGRVIESVVTGPGGLLQAATRRAPPAAEQVNCAFHPLD